MRKRLRLRFMFWLDLLKEDERMLAEYIDELKDEHEFAKTIRDGLRLMRSLRKGEADVLYELFPNLKTGLPISRSENEYKPTELTVTEAKVDENEMADNLLRSFSGFLD